MLSSISLERDRCLQQQLFDQLQALICSGRLHAGTRMPSTRMLAEQFEISRNTVVLTYDRLTAEGLLESRPAQGTFVVGPPATQRGLAVVAGTEVGPKDEVSPKIWRPDPGLFPLVRWRVLMRTALDELGAGSAPLHPAGEPALRKAIAAWLSASRNVCVSPEQIVLTESRQHAVHIASRLAVHPGQRVVVESPCDDSIEATYRDASAEILHVPVDADGVRTDQLPRQKVALLHVSPERQRPLGSVLSAERRKSLLAWARQVDSLVLEDNSQGELHYGPRHAMPLIAQDRDERVLMIGSFAASLGPWLHLAYLVVPRRLTLAAASVCRIVGGAPSRMEQLALADLMESGGYARHVHRVTKIYAARRDALVQALHRHFGDDPMLWGQHAGLHLTWFPRVAANRSTLIAHTARHCGIDALSLSNDIGRVHAGSQAVMLGFGTLSETQIDQRVQRLAEMLAKHADMALSAD
jgi:GntR family transcriptional regulator/MocR family aminotransferase